MGSPEKPVDVEMGDMSESAQLNPNTEKSSEPNGEKSTRFTGLTKEELLEISGQPGWVRARWCLFILFWLVWVGMLVGAIVIVIQAPRCKPDPELTWYQSEVGYVVDDTFGDASQHLDYVKSLSAKVVIVRGKDASDEAFKSLVESKDEKQNKEFKLVAEVTADGDNTQVIAKQWIDAGADGVLVSGLGSLDNDTAVSVANNVWQSINNDTNIALYLESSDMDNAESLYNNNNMTTVLLSAPFTTCVGQPEAAKCLTEQLAPFRGDPRNVVGYMLSPDFDMSPYQSGLNLLLLGLPGVTVIRSADEFGGDQMADFTWEINTSKDMVPARSQTDEGKAVLSNFKKFSPKKAPGIEQESSLRFDAVDGSEWSYVATDDADVLAFCRKWDAKPSMLVVSNMSPNNATDVDVTGCFKTEDGANVEEAKASDSSLAVSDKALDLTKLKIKSGQTIVFKQG